MVNGRGRWRPRLAAAAAAGLVTSYLVLPHLPGASSGLALHLQLHVGTLLFGLGAACWVAATAPGLLHPRLRVLVPAAVAGAIVAATAASLAVPVVSDVLTLAAAVPVGALFARMPDRAWHLVPAAVVLAVADAWNVLVRHGVDATNPHIVRAASVTIPVPGIAYDHGPVLGAPDLVFWAMFVAAAARWQLGTWRVALSGAAALVVLSVIQLELGAGLVLPALPVIGACFVAAAAPGLWRDLRGSTGAD